MAKRRLGPGDPDYDLSVMSTKAMVRGMLIANKGMTEEQADAQMAKWEEEEKANPRPRTEYTVEQEAKDTQFGEALGRRVLQQMKARRERPD